MVRYTAAVSATGPKVRYRPDEQRPISIGGAATTKYVIGGRRNLPAADASSVRADPGSLILASTTSVVSFHDNQLQLKQKVRVANLDGN
ncbi:hypothetical protein RRF57_009560 [Xylaria bambusicola]|uniref:Uncharacterized protein n=1 Tax=Xylaria bambusicola TaxID=326684 RepID=A0AAN7Z1R9_9PEZI